jgi:hypothetical protein
LMATHPPLVERIRRIDPQFDGRFPTVSEIHYSPSDLGPGRLASARAAAVAAVPPLMAAQALAVEPAAAVAQVGAPSTAHLDYASALLKSLPPELAVHARDPLGAVATVYALLLDESEPEVRRKQLEYLATQADPRAN